MIKTAATAHGVPALRVARHVICMYAAAIIIGCTVAGYAALASQETPQYAVGHKHHFTALNCFPNDAGS
jgi:hypothetical protein